MSYINIETITDSKERFLLSIESNGLYKINCPLGNVIEFSDKIFQISMFQNMLVILTEDRTFRNGTQNVPILKDDRIENTIIAFDSHGNFLWNIGSIVGDIKMDFWNCSCNFKEEIEKYYGVTISCNSEILLDCSTWWGNHYIVDPINKKVVYKITGKY